MLIYLIAHMPFPTDEPAQHFLPVQFWLWAALIDAAVAIFYGLAMPRLLDKFFKNHSRLVSLLAGVGFIYVWAESIVLGFLIGYTWSGNAVMYRDVLDSWGLSSGFLIGILFTLFCYCYLLSYISRRAIKQPVGRGQTDAKGFFQGAPYGGYLALTRIWAATSVFLALLFGSGPLNIGENAKRLHLFIPLVTPLIAIALMLFLGYLFIRLQGKIYQRYVAKAQERLD